MNPPLRGFASVFLTLHVVLTPIRSTEAAVACVWPREWTHCTRAITGEAGTGTAPDEGHQQLGGDSCQAVESYQGPSSGLFNETSLKF